MSQKQILEGLSVVNEGTKYPFPFETNLSDEQLKSCNKFLKKVVSFYNNILPKMDEEKRMRMSLDLANLVGQGITATLYLWGYKNLVDDEFEFDKLYNSKDMSKQVGNIVRAAIGPYQDCYASVYWNAKISINNKSMLVGPYVSVTFSESDILK